MARLIVPKYTTGAVNDGEKRVIDYLSNNLSPIPTINDFDSQWSNEEYVLIPNVEIPDNTNRFLEIDAILISPHAVYVIEVKDWGPKIEGNDQFWYLNGTRERSNPHRTLNYKCRVLRSLIEKQIPDARKIWYQGIVIVSKDYADLDLDGNCASLTFILNQGLIEYIKSYQNLRPAFEISENEIKSYQKEITGCILGKGKAKSGPKVIQGYQVEEKLSEDENKIEYLARSAYGNKLGKLKRLRVFSIPYCTQDEREKYIEKISRDYDALEAIGSNPNIVGLRGFVEHEGDKFVEVLDWEEEGTLRTVMSKGTLTLEQKLQIIKGIANGLQAAHEKGIIHRDLRPENILISSSGPQLMNFDKAYIGRSGLHTVWETVKCFSERKYLPPELGSLNSSDADVFYSSDIYSLGAIFYELISGKVPYEGPEQLELAGGKLPEELFLSKLIPGIPSWIDDLVNKMYRSEVEHRYSDTREFISELNRNLFPSVEYSKVNVQSSQDNTEQDSDPNKILQAGELIGDYRIIQHIKGGGFAQVYLATHVLKDVEYALKVYNESVPLDSLIDEFKYLDKLSHSNIVQVHWCGHLRGGRYYIAMEYLKGESLNDYVYGVKRLPAGQVFELGKDISSALRYLHEPDQKDGDLFGKSLYHRDIKPNNIIWVSNRGYVLIDFNVAKEASKSSTFAGTGRYLAPDLIEGIKIKWDDSGDTFALGVTLYELICKKHPYKDCEPRISSTPINPATLQGCEDLSETVCNFLLKAVQPRKQERFASAKEMEDEINKIIFSKDFYKKKVIQPSKYIKTQPVENKENYNPTIDKIRTLYSQAEFNNAGTRGLDDFAKETYIQTKLDDKLVPAVLNGEFKLIIITGNAGDGKTALIQQLESHTNNLSSLPSKNGNRFFIKGVPFQSNYDGSQDEGELDSDKVLEKFLAPFAGLEDFSQAKEGRILAINEGRLIEFLSNEKRKEDFGYLYDLIDKYFNKQGALNLPNSFIIVNLNWRSIVSEEIEIPSLLEKQLLKMLDPILWNKCQDCKYKKECFIYYNVQSLGDAAAGKEIRKRLLSIFEIVHLRRKMHITMRDLRSALSFLICRDYSCDDIPQLVEKTVNDNDRLDYASLAYWNITSPSNDSGENDRLIKLLREIDIGQVAIPDIDRDIYFLGADNLQFLEMAERDYDYSKDILSKIQQDFLEYSSAEMDKVITYKINKYHKMTIRKSYFEGRLDKVKNRLPYESLASFKEILNKPNVFGNETKKKLVYSISLSEGCNNKKLAENNICIDASNEKDPRWTSYRLFPIDDFEIFVPNVGKLTEYLEYTPDRFLLKHKELSNISLEVNLDLFNLISYIYKGFTPSLNDLQGKYIELIIFKNALQHLSYRSLILTDKNKNYYRLLANGDNILTMEKYNGN